MTARTTGAALAAAAGEPEDRTPRGCGVLVEVAFILARLRRRLGKRASSLCLYLYTLDNLQARLYATGMDIVTEAEQVIDEAERKLRKLIEDGLTRHMYGPVARVAQMAQAVAVARETPGSGVVSAGAGEGVIEGSRRRRPPDRPPRAPSQPASAHRPIGKYPRFQRESDRLIKVGWSKKNSTEYEHKAPLSAVQGFCYALSNMARASGSPTFVMEDLLPVVEDGEEIPDYQAYLILGWLRSLDVVSKDGRHSYKVVDPDWFDGGLDKAWSELSEGSPGKAVGGSR